jgi:hypothetical protein
MKRKEGNMKINTNHPAFVTFLEQVNSNILANINPEKYFSLPKEKKVGTQYLTLKLINQSVSVRAKLTDGELLEFTEILRKKSEESENYEFAGVLNDIISNFDTLNEMTKSGRRQKRTVKTDKTTNE